MLKVQWDKQRTWKILKKYQQGRLIALKFNGEWHYPQKDYRGRECDSSGNTYIAKDCCDYCSLNEWCRCNNPIHLACQEVNMLEKSWISGDELKRLEKIYKKYA